MNIILATGTDRNYLARIWPYFESIKKHSRARRNVVFVPVSGDDAWFKRIREFDAFDWRPVTVGELRAKNPNNCLQHGEFLAFDDPDGSEDDLIIFTDGDIVLQRWFTSAELNWLSSLPENGVAVGFNEGPWGSLAREAALLQAKQDLSMIREAFPGDWESMPCYNTGVLIARRGVYRKLCEAYIERHAEIDAMMGHYAKQQWLLSYLLNTGPFSVKLLPQEIHTHGCHPLPSACTRQGDQLFYDGTPVVFRHNVEFGQERRHTGVFRHHLFGRQPVAHGAAAQAAGTAQTGAPNDEVRASVVIASYNQFSRLAECLKSVLVTLSASDEVIISDDGSTDQTADLLLQIDSQDPRIRIVRSKGRTGRQASWDLGAQAAKGRYLVFLEPDALVPAGWLDGLCAHLTDGKVGAAAPLWDRQEGPQSFQNFVLSGLSGEFSFEQFAMLIAELNCGLSCSLKRFESHCIALSRMAYGQVSGWDGSLDPSISTLDFAWRLREAGFELRLATDVVVRDTDPQPLSISESAAKQLWEKVCWKSLPAAPPLPVEIWGAEVLGRVDEDLGLAAAA